MQLPIKQLSKLLASATNTLITGSKNPNLDTLGTAMAWQIFLSERKKKSDIVFDGQIPKYNFLPGKIKVNNDLSNLSKFKIILDVSKTKVKQLSYDINDDELIIDITPDDGVFKAGDVQTAHGDYKYDLILVLGADSLDATGQVFNENRHFFHNAIIINFDTSVLNENYGQLNIIEPNASSLAEVSYYALQKHLNKEIATCLLSGMILATNSFQSPKVNPETLNLASQLIVKGAEQEKIIEGLYRTKNISTLKSWGKVLSRLKKKQTIITSFLKYDELENLPKDFAGMIKELILSTPNVQVAIIFYQIGLEQTECHIYTISNINALDLVRDINGIGHRLTAKVIINQNMEIANEMVTTRIVNKLKIINSI